MKKLIRRQRPMLATVLALSLIALAPPVCAQPATITFVGSTTQLRTEGQTGGVNSPSSTQVGDFLFLSIARRSSSTIESGLEGWTTQRGGSSSDVLHLLWRRAETAGVTNYDFTYSVLSGSTRYVLQVWRGVAETGPINAFGYGPSVGGTFTTFPVINTTTDGCMVILVSYTDNGVFAPTTATHVGTLTLDGGYTDTGNQILTSYALQPSAGATLGATLSTTFSTAVLQPNTIALAPAPSSPPPPPVIPRRKRAPIILGLL